MRFKAALVQMSAGTEKDRNVDAAERHVREAAEGGARVVVLPEVFNYVGDAAHWPAQAESLDGPTLSRMAKLAAEHRVYLLAGSILERTARGKRIHNTSVFFGPDGSRLGVYRKMHLFDVTLPDGVVFSEVEHTEPGRDVITVSTDLGVFGQSICYDLRFPELYRLMMLARTDFVFVPSAFTAFTGQAHWQVLLRARAIENQTYVLAANQTGLAATGVAFHGHSMIVDPWGEVLVEAGEDQGVVVAEIDAERITQVRQRIAALNHVRADLLGQLGKGHEDR